MYAGRIVESMPAAELRRGAAHPYTRALVAAVEDLTASHDRPLRTLPGAPPAAGDTPAGCSFAPRCGAATAQCHDAPPPWTRLSDGHQTACWHPQVATAMSAGSLR
jgi:oligopeptide/dipeptide ABC transporter ATP-binding protein